MKSLIRIFFQTPRKTRWWYWFLSSNAVRPIFLMSYVCKLMEWMLYYRLSWFIESRPILSLAQSGFRPFRTCNDNLAVLTAVRTGFLNRTVTVAIFLDVAGTFDNIDLHILVADFFEISCPSQEICWEFDQQFDRQLSFVIETGELHGS